MTQKEWGISGCPREIFTQMQFRGTLAARPRSWGATLNEDLLTCNKSLLHNGVNDRSASYVYLRLGDCRARLLRQSPQVKKKAEKLKCFFKRKRPQRWWNEYNPIYVVFSACWYKSKWSFVEMIAITALDFWWVLFIVGAWTEKLLICRTNHAKSKILKANMDDPRWG